MLLCACHSGILMNIIICPGVSGHVHLYKLSSHMPNEGHHEYQLHSNKTSLHRFHGCRIFCCLPCHRLRGGCSDLEGGQISYVLASASLHFLDLLVPPTDNWKGQSFLGVPKKSVDNCEAEVTLTGLHWHHNPNTGGVRLITMYRHHGIQYGIQLCCNSLGFKDLLRHYRLWDIEMMAVVQSINMPSPMYVAC